MQLSFEFNFRYGGDEVLCCYTVPYTFTELQAHINELKALTKFERKYRYSPPNPSFFAEYKIIRFESIGQSLGGVDIPLLRISNPTVF